MIGASGAISGIMAAYLYLFPKSPIITLTPIGIISISAWVYIIIWFIIQLISGFMNINGNIAHFAHIGGFLYGYIYIWVRKKAK